MFERFAEEARRATALASTEARELGHDFIGTEHLLLGLLAANEGAAFSVLTELEVTLDDARRKVTERVHASGRGSVDSPPFTPLAKKSLERALREALQLKSNVIGSEHLLLGLVAVPDGGGARILVELAGNLDQVREAVLSRLGRPDPAKPGPRESGGPGPTLEQTKAPVTSKTLRRWATQGLLVLRPTASAPEEPAAEEVAAAAEEEAAAAEQAGGDLHAQPPRCPACQASLVTEARYQQVTVRPGAPTGLTDPEESGLEESALELELELESESESESESEFEPAPEWQPELEGDGTEAFIGGDPDFGRTRRGDPDPAEAITVTMVYCGQCGTALGVA